MRQRKRIIILVALCLGLCTAKSEETSWIDNILDLPAIVVPVVKYSPETEWVFGGAAQGYFRCKNQSRISLVQLDGAYSLAHQWYIKTKGNIYFGDKHNWQITYNIGYRNYPDTRYRLGNSFGIKNGESFNSDRFTFSFRPQFYINSNWSFGLVLNAFTESTTITDPLYSPRSVYAGMGAVVQYDSRDVSFYPAKGLFFSFSCSDYEPLNSYYSRTAVIHTDLRQYLSIYKKLIFAWQFKAECAWGGNRLPYSLLPTLGGDDLVRGLRANMFKDNTLIALQCELRFPIYKIVHGAAFVGIGDVYDIRKWKWETPKTGYGLGLRVSINKAKVNIRADIARNNLNGSWDNIDSYSFYLTATEAF